jgi:hypothetical protein
MVDTPRRKLLRAHRQRSGRQKRRLFRERNRIIMKRDKETSNDSMVRSTEQLRLIAGQYMNSQSYSGDSEEQVRKVRWVARQVH